MNATPDFGRAYEVAILALPRASSASICCAHDDLASIDCNGTAFGLGDETAPPAFRLRVVAPQTGMIGCAGVIDINVQETIDRVTTPDIVFIPALQFHESWMEPDAGRDRFDADVIDWIRHCYSSGAIIVSLCTGSFVLAETGLLDGLPATTHWAVTDAFQCTYPAIAVDAKQAIVVTGEGGRLIVAGTGAYHTDLILYIVQRMLGRDAAHQFAKFSGKYWAGTAQNMLARVIERYNQEDRLIADAQKWVSENLGKPDPVKAMAKRAMLTDRTFNRRFKRATGKTPLRYVQAMRIEQARCLLEQSRMPVADVAARIGYNDSGAFSRIFRREIGLTPGDYRKRFKLPPAEMARGEAPMH